jgi:HEPN domain-containing protein
MKKETEEWLKIAFEDYDAAKCLFERELYRMVCYHCQQAVEKGLKALLIEHGIDFQRTHNIIDLKNTACSLGYAIDISEEDAVFLNSVYRSRYPAALGLLPSGEPTRDDAERALTIGTVVFHIAEKLKGS